MLQNQMLLAKHFKSGFPASSFLPIGRVGAIDKELPLITITITIAFPSWKLYHLNIESNLHERTAMQLSETAKMATVDWFDYNNNVNSETGLVLAPRLMCMVYFFDTYFAGL